MKLKDSTQTKCQTGAFTLVEAIIATAILGIMTVGLGACLFSGFSVVQSTRDDLRATQIMLQRTEAMRLFNWNQLLNTNYLKTSFTEYYDPQSPAESAGTTFQGFVSTAIATNVPSAYRTNMRTITVSLYWTNYVGKRLVVHNREMQTQAARYGMQNYIWGNRW